jgi:magnesium transporter
MVRLFRRAHKRVALPPGTLEYAGEKKTEKPRITIWDYDSEHLEQKETAAVEECFPYLDTPQVSWINVDGLHDTDLIAKLGNHFGLHPLVMEDIINTHQRPKLEDYGDYLYVVARMLHYDRDVNEVSSEQVSFVLGRNFLLTFQEREGDVFEPVRERIRKTGRIRMVDADYLMYALLDAIVDNYFVLLEGFGEEIESLEENLVEDPSSELLQRIHGLKRELIIIRRSVWPLREVISGLERSESELIRKGSRVFLRDLYDHTIQVIDAVESYRDMVGGMQDLYLSSISNRMNEVMKVLTIIATVFIPLGFLAGVYGMNFEFMPELRFRWSYPIFWAAVLTVGGSMLYYFRKKQWL